MAGILGIEFGSRRLWLAVLLLLGPAVGTIYWWLLASGKEESVLAGASAVTFLLVLLFLVLTEAVGRTNSNAKRKRLRLPGGHSRR